MADETSLSGVTLPGDPTSPLEAATMQYVDQRAPLLPRTSAASLTTSPAVTSSTTLVATALSLPVVANGRYYIVASLIYTAGTTGDIKLGWTTPSGANGGYSAIGPAIGSTSSPPTASIGTAVLLSSTVSLGGLGNTTGAAIHIKGQIINGSTAGSLTLAFAQNTSDTVSTQLQGSACWLTLTRVA